jgi:hypothetical protein
VRDLYIGGAFEKGFDMDWLVGKDAAGLWQFASSILKSMRTRAERSETIDRLLHCLLDLEMAIVCIESACTADKATIPPKSMLDELDGTYGAVLGRALRFIESDPGQKYEKGTFKILASQPWRRARVKLQERFATLVPNEAHWADSLIEVTETTMGKHKIQSYAGLKSEASRLQRFSVAGTSTS